MKLPKIFCDTLMQNGKYSRKSLTAFVSLICAISIGFFIVIKPSVNIYAISVFYGFLGLSGGTLGLTVVDKLRNKLS